MHLYSTLSFTQNIFSISETSSAVEGKDKKQGQKGKRGGLEEGGGGGCSRA